jgi:hypothetical protein
VLNKCLSKDSRFALKKQLGMQKGMQKGMQVFTFTAKKGMQR